MVKPSKRVIAALGLLAGIATATQASRLEWLQTPKHTYLLMPPTLITDGSVRTEVWSPNGGYLALGTTETPNNVVDFLHTEVAPRGEALGRAVVLLYKRSSGQVQRVWSSNTNTQLVAQIVWLAKSNTAYAVIEDRALSENRVIRTYGVMSIDAAAGKFGWVPGMEHLPQEPTLIPSPKSALALAVFDDTPEMAVPDHGGAVAISASPVAVDVATPTTPQGIPDYRPVGSWVFPGANNFWLLGAGGGVNHRIKTGPAPLAGVDWGVDGSTWYFTTQNRKSKKVFIQHLEDDGRLTTVDTALYVDSPAVTPELVVQSKPMIAKQRKSKHGFNNLWLSSPEDSPHPDVMITASGGRGDLSPDQRAVFYIEGGVAKIRTVELLTDDQKRELEKAVRAETISDAKQAGLALLMFSNDMDDMLPGADGLSQLDPYLKDASLLDNFTYTPPGDLNMQHIASPAETQIGYIDGPGGRAVVFSDGHVKWYPSS